MPMGVVTIYTDGGCWPNPGGPGGWGAVIQLDCGETEELFGGSRETTNNRMELQAAIQALQHLREPTIVRLYSDSQYVVRGITTWIKGWKARNWMTKEKAPVKNEDLWRALDKEASRHRVEFRWLRGHVGHPGNERADKLATIGMMSVALADWGPPNMVARA